jgi:phage gp46-like protein
MFAVPEPTTSPSRLDFVTPLTRDDCLHTLQQGARRFADQALAVRVDGDRLWIASAWDVDKRGRPSVLWLFRFAGTLTEIEIGTHVYGRIARNPVVEGGLALAGIVVVVIGAGFALIDPWVGVLVSPVVVLLGGFYVFYQRLLRRQARDLLAWIEMMLLVPQGRAGGSLP